MLSPGLKKTSKSGELGTMYILINKQMNKTKEQFVPENDLSIPTYVACNFIFLFLRRNVACN